MEGYDGSHEWWDVVEEKVQSFTLFGPPCDVAGEPRNAFDTILVCWPARPF